jgi:tetratricopeptide (TPR) repeat protein
MTRIEGDAALAPGEVEALPRWDEYADRLGRNEYSDYAVAHSMTLLGSISFFAASNPEMTTLNAEVCRSIEQGEAPPVRQSLRAWTDPQRALVDRFPITGLVAETLYGMGRFEDAEQAFRFAAECSDPYGSRRVAFVYYELLARAAARGELDTASVARARAAIDEGRFIYLDAPTDSGRAERYVGHLHQLLGEHERAIPLLEHARGRATERLAPVIDRALVESYRATGDEDAAMRVIRDGLAGPSAAQYRAMMGPSGP